MKKLWQILFAAALCASLLTGCFVEDVEMSAERVEAASGDQSYADDSWAIYWYHCGSDLESKWGCASGDIPELQPRLFSFNNPFGACPECSGLGEKMEWDLNKILPDKSLSFNEGAFPFYNPDSEWNHSIFAAVAEHCGFSLDTPIADLTKEQFDFLWNGNPDVKLHWIYKKQSGEGYSEYNRPWPGILSDMKRRYNEAWGENQRARIEEKFMSISECSVCHGKRLRQEALGVTVGGKNIWELTELSVLESIDFFNKLELSASEQAIAKQVLKEVVPTYVNGDGTNGGGMK